VSLIPDHRLMVETDASFLYPRDLPVEQITSKTNRRKAPAILDHICEAVAACQRQTVDHVADITTRNAIKFFQLPLGETIEKVLASSER